jgi:hypothetical protein
MLQLYIQRIAIYPTKLFDTLPPMQTAIVSGSKDPMTTPPSPPTEREQCQARPAAARRGFREDVLCASLSNTTVRFHGRDVAVCRMHEATYARWGADAERKAAELWEWAD